MTFTIQGEAVDIVRTGKRAVIETLGDLAPRLSIVPTVRQTAWALTSIAASTCPGDVVAAR